MTTPPAQPRLPDSGQSTAQPPTPEELHTSPPDRAATGRPLTPLETELLRQQWIACQATPQRPVLRWVRRHSVLLMALLALVIRLGASILSDDGTSAENAKVGDCVQNRGTDSNPDVHVVSCSDPKATFKVLDVENQGVCIGSDVVAQRRESGSADLLLCLGNNDASSSGDNGG